MIIVNTVKIFAWDVECYGSVYLPRTYVFFRKNKWACLKEKRRENSLKPTLNSGSLYLNTCLPGKTSNGMSHGSGTLRSCRTRTLPGGP
jgi:hypothetical protein